MIFYRSGVKRLHFFIPHEKGATIGNRIDAESGTKTIAVSVESDRFSSLMRGGGADGGRR